MPPPDLPVAAHPDLDSMLNRKFGKEVANYFSGGFSTKAMFSVALADFLRLTFEPSIFPAHQSFLLVRSVEAPFDFVSVAE